MEEQFSSDEMIANNIYLIQGKKVMLDSDLAELYGRETKRLKQQVRRNMEGFPEHYMFKLTYEESQILRSQNVTLRHVEHPEFLVIPLATVSRMLGHKSLKCRQYCPMIVDCKNSEETFAKSQTSKSLQPNHV